MFRHSTIIMQVMGFKLEFDNFQSELALELATFRWHSRVLGSSVGTPCKLTSWFITF